VSGELAGNVLRFARVLRAAGMPVGTDRALRAVAALEAVGVTRRDDVHAAMSATMLDSHAQQPVFDAAFEAFWRDPRLLERVLASRLPQAAEPAGAPGPRGNRRVEEALAAQSGTGLAREPQATETVADAALSHSARERLRSLRKVWAVAALFMFIIGGIYLGVFTPTEAAGVGAFAGFLFAAARRELGGGRLLEVLLDAARSTCSILILLIGALVFSNFIDIAGVPKALGASVQSLASEPWMVIVVILVVYLVLGCILDSMSMLFLTVPVFYPIVSALGYDLVWFGILVVTMIEVALITPPVGLNVFVLHQVQPDIATRTIFRGLAPFVTADLIRVSLLVAVPSLALWLPGFMG